MGRIITVTSLKGGVGKTVFSASLAYTLSDEGKRVLAVDMDLGTGGLDIAMGREDTVCATLIDLLCGTSLPENALFPGDDGVFFLSAPVFFNESQLAGITQERFNALLAYLKENFDFILFDMPAGGGAAFSFFEACPLVDLTVLVTTSVPTAVRAAERCAMRLEHPEKCKMLLNCYRLSRPKDNTFGVTEVIHRTSVPIIGVVPFDSGSEKALAKGVPLAADRKSVVAGAVRNIARRLSGDDVPLLSGVLARRKRYKFY